MKNKIRNFSLLLCLTAASAYSASVPALDVTVSDKGGKVAFKGKTNAQGTFATTQLTPGNYIVQFNSKNGALKGNQYAIVVSAGKKKVNADGVSGEKFAAGGVAMKVDVGAGMKVTGQVVDAKSQSNANVKIINGKRYVWVAGETGSNLGGRWVEEGSVSANNVNRTSGDALRRAQDHADTHQEGFPSGGR